MSGGSVSVCVRRCLRVTILLLVATAAILGAPRASLASTIVSPGWDLFTTLPGTTFNGVPFQGVPFGTFDFGPPFGVQPVANTDTIVNDELFTLVDGIKKQYRLRIPCFGHAGDGNIHVNLMVDKDNADEVARAHEAERALFAGVVALEGPISGEHGIGFAKAPFLSMELSAEEIALMKRVKRAFDPNGILNPGKMFPS